MTHAAATPTADVPLKSVALPAEHGGWGLVLEPLVLGLVVAPGWPGAFVGLAWFGGFLLHHPLKLVLADARRRAMYPRTAAALKVGGVYAAVAASGLGAAIAEADGSFWWPMAAAAPVAALQLGYDAHNRGRHVVAEASGAAALAAVAPGVVLANGWSASAAAALWCVMAGRGVASVLYVRARLRRERELEASPAVPLLAHGALVACCLALVVAGLLPLAAIVVALLLLARAGWGLSPWHRRVHPRFVGFQELGWGLLTTVLLAAGYRS